MTTRRVDEPTDSSQESGVLSHRPALKAGAGGSAAVFSLSNITPALAHELARRSHGLPMTGARLAMILLYERMRWDALLCQVSLARIDIPGVEGTWSVKDLVAHLTWYEQTVVEGAQQVLSTGTFTRRRAEGAGVDDQNALIADESRTRSVDAVLAEARDVFERMLTLVEATPKKLLNDPHLLGLPQYVVPWMTVANRSYAHYRAHEPALLAWITEQ